MAFLLKATISSARTQPGDPMGNRCLGPRREFARGLVVAAGEGGLRRGEIGVGEIILAAVGHRQLRIGVGGFRLLEQRGAQQRDRLVRHLGVVGGDERLSEQDLDEGGIGGELRQRGATAGSPPPDVRLLAAPGL